MPKRTCSLCGSTKPLTEFREDKNSEDGRRNQCKECMRARKRTWYRQHSVRVLEDQQVYRDNNREMIRARDRKYYQRNSDAVRGYQRHYYRNNRDVVKSRAHAYRERNPEKVLARKRDYYERNRETLLASTRFYKKKNSHAIRRINAQRRADKLKATPAWADKELIELIYKECPIGHHVDHIVPLKGKDVCGLHVQHNLQYLPALENIRKNNRLKEF